MLSSIDDDKSLRILLAYLYERAKENSTNKFRPEELTEPTGLTLEQVNEQGNRAALSNWVKVFGRAVDNKWLLISISPLGIEKLKELEENEKKEKPTEDSQYISDNKIIAGRDVNIINAGNDNKIESKGPYSKNKKYSKTNLIIAIVIAIGTLILVGYVIYDHSKTAENNMQQTQEQNISKLNLDVVVGKGINNTTYSMIILTNNGKSMVSNVLMTINPSSEIVDFKPEFHIDNLNLQKTGPMALKAEIPRVSACSKVFIRINTSKQPTDENIDVFVTYDNMASPLAYDTKINGTKWLSGNGTSIPTSACK